MTPREREYRNDGRITPGTFRNIIRHLGLSQEDAGRFFGYSARQGQRWALGEAEIPKAVEYALRLMAATGTKPGELNKDFRK